jgi:tetratricopeptide (TPR) repeat protein
MGKKSRKLKEKQVSIRRWNHSTDKTVESTTETGVTRLKFWHKILPPAILSSITAAFYYPSLTYPFQFDDLANITKKFDIRFSDPLSSWWRNRRWMGEWLNRLNFEWGRFDPYYYRLTNLIVHILVGVLVFFLILEGCAYLKKRVFFAKHALAIASATSALFLLHPVQTQAVSYAIQARLEGLATFFVLLTLFLFLKAFQVKNIFVKYGLVASTLLIGFISCGTKEIAIVSPFLAILIDWFFLAEESWENFKSRLWFHGVFSFVIFATFIHYLTPKYVSEIASLKVTTANNRGNVLTKHAHDVIKPFDFLISEFKVILHYLSMFLWPFSISVEYDWKLSESFFAPDSFFPFLSLVSLFALSCYSIIKKKFTFFGIGLLWFFVAVAPRSTIIPSPELICDYKTYLASIGWLFILATAFVATITFIMKNISKLPSFLYKPIPQLAIVVIFALPIGYGAMQRNIVWSTPVEFWRDITIKAPYKARGHNNLGVALSEENKFSEAIPCYIEAIRLDRFYSDPWSNLAVAYSVQGDTDKAIGALKQAIRIFPNYPEAFNNLGTLMIKKKNYEAAEKILNTALRLRPYYGKAFYNLGRLYMDKGDHEKAWQYFKKATEGDLDTTEGFFTFGQMSLRLKKYDYAAKAFSISLQRVNQRIAQMSGVMRQKNITYQHQVMFNLANSYFMLKEYDRATSIYEILCQADPNNYRYWYNFGEALYTKKDFVRATEAFKRLSSPPFNMAQAGFRYAQCLEKTNNLSQAKSVLETLAKTDQLPANLKQMAQNEIGRIALQLKVNSGNCTLTMKDLQQAFHTTGTS